MEKLDVEKLKEVGNASVEALNIAAQMIKPGAKLIDVAKAAEGHVAEKGFDFAFPINISINGQAAHYTPSLNDELAFGENDIVKLDFGAAKDGLLGDVALTVSTASDNRHASMLEATKEALDEAISMVKAGARVSDIGKAISAKIEAKGFQPIRNLGGHGVGVHNLHADIFIPNYDNGDDTALEEGQLIAIEPFATLKNGKGIVVEGDAEEIFQFEQSANVRMENSRKLLKAIMEKYSTEPFAARWLGSVLNDRFALYSSLHDLMRAGAISSYPVLVESSGAIVSQHEAEMVVGKDSCDVVAIV
ncbi:MAG: type II methionyl aminopeptidase [Candidatus Marsarchaeota archaeon]|jgi:methionyl aminopeptidase|nr:type II methionyl aminopeptidase [Candidatus Marsarchaeota archaeon]MCL5418689.1 type II methionyl aminopeptidase [Candidatus Marsarchaeota archaeon]